MNYEQLYTDLRNRFDENSELIQIDNYEMNIQTINFISTSALFDPLHEEKNNGKKLFNSLLNYYLGKNRYSKDYIFSVLAKPDETVGENNNFGYIVFKNQSSLKSSSVIILLHGLNERSWDKYLPWAYALFKQTGKTVLLFPLSFHMNRAPKEWSDPRLMKQVSLERSNLLPGLECSSFANAALSTRIQFLPKRFLLSGLQTFEDINFLMTEIRADKNEIIAKDASIDFFCYSIGSFLAEILFMCNTHNLYSDSRLFNFCGGSTLDQTMPVSKAIMDSEADIALKDYYRNEFEKDIERDEFLSTRIRQLDDKGISFISMLGLEKFQKFREDKLIGMKERIKTLIFAKDKVFSPAALEKTFPDNLSGDVVVKDYNYQYAHENPFPMKKEISGVVNSAFGETFKLASSFLS